MAARRCFRRSVPPGGTFHRPTAVALTCPTEGATIEYTTELGKAPRWKLYTGPLRLRAGELRELRFRCGRLGYFDSEIVRYSWWDRGSMTCRSALQARFPLDPPLPFRLMSRWTRLPLTIVQRRCYDATNPSPLCAAVSAPDGRAGAHRPYARGAGSRIVVLLSAEGRRLLKKVAAWSLGRPGRAAGDLRVREGEPSRTPSGHDVPGVSPSG